MALLHAAENLKVTGVDEEEEMGVECVRKALESPIRQLSINAGKEPAEVIRSLRGEKPTMGYDLVRDEVCDLLKEGIIDPAKVTRTALENAASVATLLLTAEALIANAPKEEAEGNGHHHHHDEEEEMGGDF